MVGGVMNSYGLPPLAGEMSDRTKGARFGFMAGQHLCHSERSEESHAGAACRNARFFTPLRSVQNDRCEQFGPLCPSDISPVNGGNRRFADISPVNGGNK